MPWVSAQTEQAAKKRYDCCFRTDACPTLHAPVLKGNIMKHSTSRRTEAQTGSKAAGNELTPWNLPSEFSRQQLAVATESASAIYRGSEALRKIQQQTAHEASVRHAQAAQKLLAPCQPADLLSIQSELLRADMQSAGHYWQQLAAATMQAQREMMASMSHLLDRESSGANIKSAMEAFLAAIPTMAMTDNFLTSKPHEPNMQSSSDN